MLTSRSAADWCVTSWPSIKIRPVVGCSSPATRRNVVVLPQPDGPSSVTSVPRAMLKVTLFTAVTGP